MAKRIRWDRLEHAYVAGEVGMRELAKKYGCSLSRVSEEAKKRDWVGKRKRFRNECATEAIARARAREVDKLENVRAAADKMGEALKKIMEDEKQLYLHTGICRDGDNEYIEERQLDAVNRDTLRAIAGALKDMTQVLRNLYDIQTKGEKEQLNMARERLNLEKAKVEDGQGDRKIEISFAGETEDAAG